MPHDTDTLHEYGFVRATKAGTLHELFDFWIEVIVTLEIPARSLRVWRRNWVLCREIKLAYANSGRVSTSQAFEWFQANQWIVEQCLPIPQRFEDEQDADVARVCQYTGLPHPRDPNLREIRAALPNSQAICYDLCQGIFCHISIFPPTHLWILFGFGVCKSDSEERTLEEIYKRLFQLHPFEEIWRAYDTGVLGDLIEPLLSAYEPGWGRRRELLYVLEAPRFPGYNWELVWRLKAAVLIEEPYLINQPGHPLRIFYGFGNAESMDDVRELKRLYRRLFRDDNVIPTELHRAAVKWELYRFVDSILGFERREQRLFRRLLRRYDYIFGESDCPPPPAFIAPP
ncbi:hypothetical protein EVJ58_g7542 [Rhodofomes roseus]|uniref:Uncharacterized protein n=1 Tax=Rhodofomes roseus TaxID=34475 RepID=A0A4Y9Y323_9APHY|nr:hypothetical protein EVJ58_g7542 [Rhodofomes roseus]